MPEICSRYFYLFGSANKILSVDIVLDIFVCKLTCYGSIDDLSCFHLAWFLRLVSI